MSEIQDTSRKETITLDSLVEKAISYRFLFNDYEELQVYSRYLCRILEKEPKIKDSLDGDEVKRDKFLTVKSIIERFINRQNIHELKEEIEFEQGIDLKERVEDKILHIYGDSASSTPLLIEKIKQDESLREFLIRGKIIASKFNEFYKKLGNAIGRRRKFSKYVEGAPQYDPPGRSKAKNAKDLNKEIPNRLNFRDNVRDIVDSIHGSDVSIPVLIYIKLSEDSVIKNYINNGNIKSKYIDLFNVRTTYLLGTEEYENLFFDEKETSYETKRIFKKRLEDAKDFISKYLYDRWLIDRVNHKEIVDYLAEEFSKSEEFGDKIRKGRFLILDDETCKKLEERLNEVADVIGPYRLMEIARSQPPLSAELDRIYAKRNKIELEEDNRREDEVEIKKPEKIDFDECYKIFKDGFSVKKLEWGEDSLNRLTNYCVNNKTKEDVYALRDRIVKSGLIAEDDAIEMVKKQTGKVSYKLVKELVSEYLVRFSGVNMMKAYEVSYVVGKIKNRPSRRQKVVKEIQNKSVKKIDRPVRYGQGYDPSEEGMGETEDEGLVEKIVEDNHPDSDESSVAEYIEKIKSRKGRQKKIKPKTIMQLTYNKMETEYIETGGKMSPEAFVKIRSDAQIMEKGIKKALAVKGLMLSSGKPGLREAELSDFIGNYLEKHYFG
ncbi:hypothetical protein KY332_04470 [Candidatus Woesearchaeota archaeon]|nr:hypothetical protein [Candidatus Woesearchaeota archaeon]